MNYGPDSRLLDVLRNSRGRAAIGRVLPHALALSHVDNLRALPVCWFADREPAIIADRAKEQELWRELAVIEADPAPLVEEHVDVPAAGYEGGDVPEGSAAATVPPAGSRWSPVEIHLDGPSHGNPFTDVELTASFRLNGQQTEAGGFYDGEGRWVIRFLPQEAGTLRFITSSSARSLHGISGTVQIGEARAGNHGPVRVDGFHFVHADGSRHLPLGTTAYAWLHQPEQLRAATLRTLRDAPFTKLRMCVFPKSFPYNSNDPDLYPFARDPDGRFDWTRFDPRFFRRLEAAVADLGVLGIQADIILFHPYDRWGFADMGIAADHRYVRYLVRRLWAYPNVWWSMANEYDFVPAKQGPEWDRIGRIVAAGDPAGHPRSIHNGHLIYDHSRGWVTHASIQRSTENTDRWRGTWKKPVIIDECGYEGNLPYGWGNLPGRELVRRFWDAAVRGGYAGHGETYYRDDEQIWWAKGGELTGEAPERIAFLRRIIEQSPGGALDPIPLGSVDVPVAGVEGQFYLLYFGFSRPLYCELPLPAGGYRADVIDTWHMTIESSVVTSDAILRVGLGGRENLALRLVALGPE
jgi:hypothetical protein